MGFTRTAGGLTLFLYPPTHVYSNVHTASSSSSLPLLPTCTMLMRRMDGWIGGAGGQHRVHQTPFGDYAAGHYGTSQQFKGLD